MSDSVGLGICALTFLIVLVVTWNVLPKMGYQGISRATLAFCVAALSIVGLFLGPPSQNQEGEFTPLLIIPIPFAALGLTLLLFPFLYVLDLAMKRRKEHEERKQLRGSERFHDIALDRIRNKEQDDFAGRGSRSSVEHAPTDNDVR